MIRDILLPEQYKGYYVFAKRIIGFDIGKTHVNATQMYLTGRTRIIEKFFEEKLEAGPANNNREKIVKAIQTILAQVDAYDAIHSSLSSAVAVFKELKLPFLQYDKINMVVTYEVEPLLPFPVAQATIDFIITKQHSEENSSEILVAAVQNQHIANHIQLFEEAGVRPELLTIDLFEIYGLYSSITSPEQIAGNSALIDLGIHSTRIAFLQEGQLRFIRVLPKGTYHLAKGVSETLAIPINQAMETIIRFGLENSDNPIYIKALSSSLAAFWNEIQFTLLSFTTQAEDAQALMRLILLGGGAEIKGLPKFIIDHLHVACELFPINKVLEQPTIQLKSKLFIPTASIISLSTALPLPVTQSFNMCKGTFTLTDPMKFTKQLIVGASLLLFVFIILLTHSFFQIRKLKHEAQASQKEIITTLKEKFPTIEKEAKDLDEVIESAKKIADEKEKMWFAFSARARSSFLKYLLELFSKVDKVNLGLDLEKITITEKEMALTGQVKDWEPLNIFVRELGQSKLFSVEPKPESTKINDQVYFKNMKVILNKTTREE